MLPFWDFGPSFLVDLGVFWQKWFSQSCLFGMMKISFVGSPIQIWAFSGLRGHRGDLHVHWFIESELFSEKLISTGLPVVG